MGPGGTIAKYATQRDVYLICATDGNGRGNPDPKAMGQIRKQELLAAAEILGVKKVDFLGFDDGELSNNLFHQLAERIEEKIKEYQPDTLLTFDLRGMTGHLDHIAVALATSFCFKRLDFVKTLLYYCASQDFLDSFTQNYFIFVPPGYTQDQVNLKVDIKDFFEKKIAAIKEHKSQEQDGARVIAGLRSLDLKTEHFLKLEK
jgi:LmbE family N-acetylglucosaminyl deacetylase